MDTWLKKVRPSSNNLLKASQIQGQNDQPAIGVSHGAYCTMCATISLIQHSTLIDGDINTIDGQLIAEVDMAYATSINNLARFYRDKGLINLNDCFRGDVANYKAALYFASWYWGLSAREESGVLDPKDMEDFFRKLIRLSGASISPINTDGTILVPRTYRRGNLEIDLCRDIAGIAFPQWYQPTFDIDPDAANFQMNFAKMIAELTETCTGEEARPEIENLVWRVRVPTDYTIIVSTGKELASFLGMCKSPDLYRKLPYFIRLLSINLNPEEARVHCDSLITRSSEDS